MAEVKIDVQEVDRKLITGLVAQNVARGVKIKSEDLFDIARTPYRKSGRPVKSVAVWLISTNVGKHPHANMHTDGRSCNSRNRLRPLPRHHSTLAGAHDD
jgi:hypothetical protein